MKIETLRMDRKLQKGGSTSAGPVGRLSTPVLPMQ